MNSIKPVFIPVPGGSDSTRALEAVAADGDPVLKRRREPKLCHGVIV